MDDAHAASCEEMATAMSSAEGAAYKGLQQCLETVMAEVCSLYLFLIFVLLYGTSQFVLCALGGRLLSAEQKVTDYCSPDVGIAPDHRPTNACTRVVAYLCRVLKSPFTALEGLNKQAFLTELV
ncbi:exocyst complex component sec10 [Perilla frutescens var. frutescens]|nr:exocyst complex component sec10 [Perilla frutescens var. frutescens]